MHEGGEGGAFHEENYTHGFSPCTTCWVVSARLLVQPTANRKKRSSRRQNHQQLSSGNNPDTHALTNTYTKTATATSSLPPGTVNVSPEKQQLIGVKVATVEKAPWNPTLRVLGRVAPDENRIFRIIAATDGWSRKFSPSRPAAWSEKDELLATSFPPSSSRGLRLPLRPEIG